LSIGDRDRFIRGFREGRTQCLTSVSVLTTGFNVPQVDLIAMLRPTLSTGLYVQIAGRGFRLAPGKENCLVLDFAGNVRRHGPVDDVTIKEPGKGDGEAPVKECPECHSMVHASLKACPDCGYAFPPNEEEKHEAKASVVPILSRSAPAPLLVNDVQFRRHQKFGKPDSLVVEYRCGLTVHKEWVCLEHEGYPGQRAAEWWRRMRGSLPAPKTVIEALDRIGELARPVEISVRPSGTFFEIVHRRLPSLSEAAE
jgi:DNA repair protein RadD